MAKEWLQHNQAVQGQIAETDQAKSQQLLVYGRDFISAHEAQIAERLAEITASATGRLPNHWC